MLVNRQADPATWSRYRSLTKDGVLGALQSNLDFALVVCRLRRDKDASPHKIVWSSCPVAVLFVDLESFWTLDQVSSYPSSLNGHTYHSLECFRDAIPPNTLTVDCICANTLAMSGSIEVSYIRTITALSGASLTSPSISLIKKPGAVPMSLSFGIRGSNSMSRNISISSSKTGGGDLCLGGGNH